MHSYTMHMHSYTMHAYATCTHTPMRSYTMHCTPCTHTPCTIHHALIHHALIHHTSYTHTSFSGGHPFGGTGQNYPTKAVSNRSLLLSAGWKPFAPLVHADNGPAFASTFPADDGEEVFLAIVGFGAKSNASSGWVNGS
jgi:hypothetical protein